MGWIAETKNPSGPQLQAAANGSKNSDSHQAVPNGIRDWLTGQSCTANEAPRCGPCRAHLKVDFSRDKIL